MEVFPVRNHNAPRVINLGVHMRSLVGLFSGYFINVRLSFTKVKIRNYWILGRKINPTLGSTLLQEVCFVLLNNLN
jgi:hypothetical protein